MKKTILILIFLTILYTNFIYAQAPTDWNSCYDFENNTNDINKEWNWTNTGGTFVTGLFGDSAIEFNGINQYLSTTQISSTTKSYTIHFWAKVRDIDSALNQFFFDSDPAVGRLICANARTNLMQTYDGTYNSFGISPIESDEWTPIAYVFISGTGGRLYINGTQAGVNITYAPQDLGGTTSFAVGSTLVDGFVNGTFDELLIYERGLTANEIYNISIGGELCNPAPIPQTANESIETSIDFQQQGNTIIAGLTTTIFSGDFNITVNNSKLYVGIVSQVLSNLDNTLFCEANINGTVYGNSTRSNIGGEEGINYLTTNNISLDIGKYGLEFECSRQGAGIIQINNTDGTIHLQIDEINRSMNYQFNNIEKSINSTSFIQIDSFLFTVNDTNETGGIVQNIILDWSAEYENTGTSSTRVTTYLDINGTKCTNYPRVVDASNIGSLSGDCKLINVTPNSILNISLYANGSTSDIRLNVHTKNFYAHSTQINSFNLTNIVINSSSFTRIANFSLELDETHLNADIFVKAGIPLNNSAVGSQGNFFFNLTNGVTFINSEVYKRTVDENTGVAILQHQFDNANAGNYTVELWASCSNPDCKIQGGEVIGYVVNTKEIVPNSFNLSVFDIFDNSTINNFSVSINSETTLNSLLPSINIFAEGLVNLTLNSSFDGGYFSTTILNHNSSNDLNVSMKQTDITINFIFDSGDLLNFTNINFTDTSGNFSYNVSTGTLNIFPKALNLIFITQDLGNIFRSFNTTFNFTALENNTYNLSVDEFNNELTFIDANTTLPINNATISITYPSGKVLNVTTNSTGSVNFSYDYNGSLEFGDYSFFVNKKGYINLTIEEDINVSNIPFIKSYNVSRAKIIINVFNRDGHLLLSGINVSIAFVGLFNETITTGTLIKNNLSIVSGDYIIYASSEGFKTEARFFSFTNQEEITIDFYLLNLTDPSVGLLFVRTTDSFFRKITDSVVNLLEYSPSDLSFISVSQCITNINAECSFNVELNKKTYYLSSTAIIGETVFKAETSQTGEIFTVTNELRNLVFYTREEFIVNEANDLIYSITESFINNISQISVEFSSISGNSIEVCIEYFIRNGVNFQTVTGDTYCLFSSSAIQNIDTSVTLNRSNNYEARVYIKESSNDVPLDKFLYPSENSIGEIFDEDFIGALVMILWLFALAICIHGKNVTIFFILAILLSWGELIIFPSYSLVPVSILKTIISGFTIMVSRKKKDFT